MTERKVARRVLLTGATGFIGSRVARLLVERGCEVAAVVRPSSNKMRLQGLETNLQFLCGDFHESLALDAQLQQYAPDTLLHMAWFAEPGKYLMDQRNIGDMTRSMELFRLAAQSGVNRIVGIGTCLEYAASSNSLAESSPLGPRSLYASSKAALSMLANAWAQTCGMSFAWCRLFYAYGPGEDPRRLVPSIVLGLLARRPVEIRAGNLVRDYLHVDDVAEAIVEAALSDVAGPINIGSGDAVQISDIGLAIAREMQHEELLRIKTMSESSSEPPVSYANVARLQSATGWVPKYTLQRGLTDTIDWWRAHQRGDGWRSVKQSNEVSVIHVPS